MLKFIKISIAILMLLITTTNPAMAQAPVWTPPKVLTIKEKVQLEFGDTSVMVRIANAESKFIATAKNPNSSASGVFQILRKTWSDYRCLGEFETARFDADKNIACARRIYDRSGTSPWNESRSNWE